MDSQTQAPPTQAQPSNLGITIQAWLLVNRKRVAWFAAGLGVLVLVLFAFFQQQSGREADASRALSDLRVPFNPAVAPEPGTADKLLQIANQYKGTKAAAMALQLSAG